ncbi:MAG: hypothetical protein LQ350_007279 [Teloschistes chrysophthalmus]|nr:MAG: hypothetical protein LQ350_007279 [Niorma chrysophthalma]
MSTNSGRGLVFWKDITPSPAPLKIAGASSPRILVVGGGVIGLTTAWALLDRGYKVTVVASRWASWGKEQRLTSQIAGALWEYPPTVCGQHTDAISLQKSKIWCMVAYHIWDAIAASDELSQTSGVRMKSSNFFFPGRVEDSPVQLKKMKDLMASGIKGFRHDPKIIQDRQINEKFGAVDAYKHLAPIIDTDVAMEWLTRLVERKGAKLVIKTLTGDLFFQESELRAAFDADAIVNATGLSGTELAGDSSCYPIRGGLLRVINDGSDFPKLDHAMAITAGTFHKSSEIVFLVPRNDSILLIGGITEPEEDQLSLTIDSPIIQRMRARCQDFWPDLKRARLDTDYPLAQGLRPFRRQNVRVERELRMHEGSATGKVPSRIVHSYGHGGAGWSLSFGCASDVVALVEEALLNLLPTPMATEATSPNVRDPFVARL